LWKRKRGAEVMHTNREAESIIATIMLKAIQDNPELEKVVRDKITEAVDGIDTTQLSEALCERLSDMISNLDLDNLYETMIEVVTEDATKKIKKIFSQKSKA
jgi:hypothetical protein